MLILPTAKRASSGRAIARRHHDATLELMARDGAECRSQADEVTERAWKNHQQPHRGRV
jgi:hypothetical protein